MNPNDVGLGPIIIGLLIVMTLATAVYMLGVFAVTRMRHSRVEEETTITFPDQPQGSDDQREVEQVLAREQGGETVHVDSAGRPMRPVRQSPQHLGERPVDADHDRGVAPRPGVDGPGTGKNTRNPL